jgi:hypothetical protein
VQKANCANHIKLVEVKLGAACMPTQSVTLRVTIHVGVHLRQSIPRNRAGKFFIKATSSEDCSAAAQTQLVSRKKNSPFYEKGQLLQHRMQQHSGG